jgi:hypothetical protein
VPTYYSVHAVTKHNNYTISRLTFVETKLCFETIWLATVTYSDVVTYHYVIADSQLLKPKAYYTLMHADS